MQKVFNRLVVALMVTGGLIGSALIGVFATGGPQLFGINAFSVVGFVLSSILGVWLLVAVVRSGRL
jgi:ubiquinone biosynthesis protein